MPDRYVREGLLRSEAWNGLNFEGQSLFVRVILLVDDFGCFDGRDDLVASYAFPTSAGSGTVPFEEFVVMMRNLHLRNLIMRYSNNGKPYIAIQQWSNDLRGARKFPAPPTSNDLPGIKYRGKYGKPIGWVNPAGSAEVSVLLGPDNRPIFPQPAEWRNVHSDWSPITVVTAVTGRQSLTPVTAHESLATSHGMPEAVAVTVTESESVAGGGVGGGVGGGEQSSHSSPVTASTATPEINGQIKFKDGSFVGLTEEQRLKWQDMCNDISIPDQVARAAAWLSVNNGERAAIEKQGEGFGAFLVRWLLREQRGFESKAG